MRPVRKLMLLCAMAAVATAMAAPSAFAQTSATEPLSWPANTGLEVRDEVSGTLCSAVTPAVPPAAGNFTTTGSCITHIFGDGIVLSVHMFGIEMVESTCDFEFDFRVANNGLGFLTHQELTGNASCTRRPCHYPNDPTLSYEPPSTRSGTHNEARPWRAKMREIAAGNEALTVLFCFEPRHTASLEPTPKRHCEVTIPFSEKEDGEPADHRYHFDARPDVPGTGSPRCEIGGEFEVEMTQAQGPGPTEAIRKHLEINHD